MSVALCLTTCSFTYLLTLKAHLEPMGLQLIGGKTNSKFEFLLLEEDCMFVLALVKPKEFRHLSNPKFKALGSCFRPNKAFLYLEHVFVFHSLKNHQFVQHIFPPKSHYSKT